MWAVATLLSVTFIMMSDMNAWAMSFFDSSD